MPRFMPLLHMFYGDFRSEHGERETGKLKKNKNASYKEN